MMPDMSSVVDSFADDMMRFCLVDDVISDGEVTRKTIPDFSFNGMLIPLPARKVELKPEGQRTWRWFTLYTTQFLAVGKLVEGPDCRRYKVMSSSDWGGHKEYQLAEGAQ